MTRRKNIHPYLSNKTYDRFKGFCAAEGATESSVVEEALLQYLDQTTFKKLQLKHLETIANALGPLQRDFVILMEMHFAFIKLWMHHNQELPADRKKKQAHAVAERAQRFKAFVAKTIADERLAINDLVRQAVTLEGLLGTDTDDEAA